MVNTTAENRFLKKKRRADKDVFPIDLFVKDYLYGGIRALYLLPDIAKEHHYQLVYLTETSFCHAFFGLNKEILGFNKNMARFVKETYAVDLESGIAVTEIIQGEQLDNFSKLYQQALQGKVNQVERAVKYAEQETIWWEMIYEPSYNRRHEITGVSFRITNITDKKLKDQKIVAQKKSLQEIAYIQSHLIRGPLASILGLVEIFRYENYQASMDELQMLELVAKQLDEVIKTVIFTATDSS
jgi:signal transduction histidine kinase